jgi:pimeloyl-ACP methyl ester carboxylesterase
MIDQRLRMDEVDYPPLWLKTHGTLNFERRNVKAMGMAGVLQLHTWYRYDKNLYLSNLCRYTFSTANKMDDDGGIVVNYPLPGNDEGGRVFIYGLNRTDNVSDIKSSNVQQDSDDTCSIKSNPSCIQVLFFCGGFPDHWSTFRPLAQRLCSSNNSKNYDSDSSSTGIPAKHIVCGVTCLPGYDTHHSNFKSGYTFDEMVVSLQSACKVLLSTVTEKSLKDDVRMELTGVFHDWGSYVGAMAVNRSNHITPHYYKKVVFFDVLPPTHPKLRIRRETPHLLKSLILMSYTSLFATSHTIQRYLSYWLAFLVHLIGYCILFVLGILPVRWNDYQTFLSDRPREYTVRKQIYMQYPYYELWRGFLFQGPKKFLKTTLSDATLPENVTSVDGTPVLYLYGTKKNAMFHDSNVLAWLQQQNPAAVVHVDDAGHWLYRQKENICYESILKFIGLSK